MAKTITSYYGGKYNKVGEFIVSILPEHRYYVELCGGMAGVLMMKKPSFQEVYNDIDEHLVNLFRVVRNAESFTKFRELLELTPYSRDEWKYCEKRYRKETDSIERARQTYVVLSQGYSGSLGRPSWSNGGAKYDSSVSRTFFNGLQELDAIRSRLRDIIIENQPAIKIANRYNTPKALLYWDPPYLADTRRSAGNYNYEMTSEQHLEMLEFLATAKAKVIISGYRSKLYDRVLLKSGFTRVEVPTLSAMSRSRKDEYSAFRTECLWINYSPNALANPLLFPTNATENAHEEYLNEVI